MNFSRKNNDDHLAIKLLVSKTKLTLLILVISIGAIAQNGINYKAVIKDDLGNVMANSNIDIQLSIEISAVPIYVETHNVYTNANGVVMLNIGEGTVTEGTFDTIDWKNERPDLNVKVDIGNGYVDLGSTTFKTVPYAIRALKTEGIEEVIEGGNRGWRLSNAIDENHANIGENALDFSNQTFPSSTFGASGELSVAFGNLSEASGYSSFAMGYAARATGEQAFSFGEQSSALGDFSISMGFNNGAFGNYTSVFGYSNIVRGDYSFSTGQSNTISNTSEYAYAFGRSNAINGEGSVAFGEDNNLEEAYYSLAFGQNNEVSGYNSLAFGYQNNATGNSSIAIGTSTAALGSRSVAIGSNVTAYSSYETVFGRYNTEYSPEGENTDRLFVVANGYVFAGVPIRSNALTILKNGNTGIGTNSPQELLHISGGRLRIGTETIEDTGSNRLSFNASLLPDNDDAMNLGNSSFRWNAIWAVDGTINTSDRREKKNIKGIKYGLNEVLQMQPVSFNCKNKNNPDLKLGLIAQDLLKLVPEVVKSHVWETDEISGTITKKELDRLGVHYSDLVPILIKAIQEQQKIINKQTINYSSLLDRVEVLEKRISN